MKGTITTTKERGFTVIEVLVSIVILGVVGLAVAMNTIKSYTFLKRGIRNSYAAQLALDKIETLAAKDPSTLSSANNQTESGLSWRNVKFNRTTTITVNSDGSRTISVSVTGANKSLGGKANMVSTLPLWQST